MLEAVKVWPGKGGACHEVGAAANLDSSCARRPGAAAGRDEETGFSDRTKKLMKDKRCAGVPKLLDKKSPIQGTSGANREAESTDALERGGLPRSSDEAG